MTPAKSRQGQDLCGAKKRNGEPCGAPAGSGTDHLGIGCCKHHGGSTPNHVKSANVEKANRAAETFGLPREIDPHTALIEELHRTAGIVAWYGQQIAALEDGQFHESIGGSGGGETQQELHVFVRALERERKHFTDVARVCISVGIEERRVQLAEQQGQLLAEVIRGVLEDLKVKVTPEVQAVVRNRLTVLAGGKAA